MMCFRTRILGALVLCAALFWPSAASAQASTLRAELLRDWRDMEGTLAALAEAMPEDRYSFKTTPPQRDFAQQLLTGHPTEVARFPKALREILPPSITSQQRVYPRDLPLDIYNEVWDKTLAQRRVLDLGAERVSRAKLSADNRRLEDFEVLIEGRVERRIVFAPDGTMYVTGADAFRFYDSDLDSIEGRVFTDNPDVRRNFTGRVIRIKPDGTIPADNPWLGRATVSRETFAHGFKDPEGAAINPATGELWLVDHGPQGGDEINIVRAGHDYGWPEVSYGVQYDARQTDGRKNVRVGTGQTSMKGVEEPIYYWVPSIGPSGMTFYTGDQFPEWKGNLFIGAMPGQHLVRLVLKDNRVVAEEKLLVDRKQRIREVRQGPDGNLYIFLGTDLVRLTPKK